MHDHDLIVSDFDYAVTELCWQENHVRRNSVNSILMIESHFFPSEKSVEMVFYEHRTKSFKTLCRVHKNYTSKI
jgi:hypothetical protein